jgi:hypothetical protein
VKRVSRRKKRRSRRDAAIEQDRESLNMMSEDILTDFSIDELREFLEADLVDVKVDPEFKERLRKQLWDLVQERARTSQRTPN